MASGSTNRKLGVALSYAYSACQAVVYLLYVPLLLDGIGQEEYGLYQMVGSMASYVVSIGSLLSAGVSRYYCKALAEGDGLAAESTLTMSRAMYRVATAVGLALFAALAAGANAAYAGSLPPAQLRECTLMLGVLAANMAVSFGNAVDVAAITGHERFAFLNGLQLAALLAQPLAVLLAIRVWPSALAVTCVSLAANAAAAAARRLYARRALRVSPAWRGWDRGLARGLLSFGGATLLVTVADLVFWNADQLIVGYFLGTSAVAVYAVGSKLYLSYKSVGVAMSSVFMPEVSRIWHGGHDLGALSALFARVGRLSAMALLAVLLEFALFGRDFVRLWAGESYGEAYWVALVVMVPFTVDLVQNVGLTILQAMDRYYFRGAIYSAIAAANVVSTVLLVQRFGIVGAAASTGVAMFVGNGPVMNWYYSRRVGLDVRGFWGEVGRAAAPVLALGAAAGALWALARPAGVGWPVLVAAMAAFLAAYCLVLWRFSMNGYEKGLVRGFLRSRGR